MPCPAGLSLSAPPRRISSLCISSWLITACVCVMPAGRPSHTLPWQVRENEASWPGVALPESIPLYHARPIDRRPRYTGLEEGLGALHHYATSVYKRGRGDAPPGERGPEAGCGSTTVNRDCNDHTCEVRERTEREALNAAAPILGKSRCL